MTKRDMKQITDRDRKRIEKLFPILLPTEDESRRDGVVLLLGVRKDMPRAYTMIPVQRFVPTGKETAEIAAKVRGLDLIGRLEAVANSGEKVDHQLLEEGFADGFVSAAEDVYGKELARRISEGATDSPGLFSRHWLPILGTHELRESQLVVWQPNRGPVGVAQFCANLSTAAVASLVLSRMFTGLRSCLGCGVIFKPERLDQDFHDLRCGNLHRKNRQRRRQAKGGK